MANKGLEALKQLHRLAYGAGFSIQEIKQSSIIKAALKEHEQYKAIEEELGIDLPTLIKAQTQGFLHKRLSWHKSCPFK